MDEKLLQTLLTAPDEGELQAVIDRHQVDLSTLAALKRRVDATCHSQPAEAVRLAETIRRLSDLLPEPAPALGRWILGNALLAVDRYREAADLYEQARQAYLALDRPLDAARLGIGQVWALAYTGRFQAALTLAEEIEPQLSRAARTDETDRARLGLLFNNLGITYELMGRYEEALAAYERRVTIARELGDELALAHVHHNRACALIHLNAFEEALAAFDLAETAFQKLDVAPDLARLHMNRGRLWAVSGRYEEAETALLTADRYLAGLAGMRQHRHTLAVYRAMIHRQGERPLDSALCDLLRQAQAGLAEHGPLFEEGLAWIGLGYCALAQQNWSQARRAFEQAHSLAAGGAGQPLAYLGLYGLGQLAEARSDPRQAIQAYETAIQQLETIRRDLHIELFRSGFLQDKLDIYRDLTRLYLQQEELSQAFLTVERSRARLLAERLAFRLDEETARLEQSDNPHIRELARRLRRILLQLKEVAPGEEGAEVWFSQPSQQAVDRVAALEKEAQHLIWQLERSQPLFSPLTVGEIAPLDRIQAHLQETTLLQYYAARRRIGLFVVNEGGVAAHYDLADLAELEMIQTELAETIQESLSLSLEYGPELAGRFMPGLLAETNDRLARLYDLLIRPVAGSLPPDRAIVVSPDDMLHYIPFQALYDGERYLVERRLVSYTPSATVLDMCARQTVTGQRQLIVGYGGEWLKEVSGEVEALAGLFPEAEVWPGQTATTDRLLATAADYQRIHLAAHAHFRPDNVMFSAIALADRPLTLAEIARLRLNAALVTLSGCETGYGRMHGADLFSLAGGFLGAGARSLLVSLWPVDDAITARLMVAFYQAMQSGQNPAVALRTAQLKLLAEARQAGETVYRHPAYWAPFILMGAAQSGLSRPPGPHRSDLLTKE